MGTNDRFDPEERELNRHASDLLRRCTAGVSVAALQPPRRNDTSIELFDLKSLDRVLRDARLLSADARETRLGYLKRVSALGHQRPLAAALQLVAIETLRQRFPNFGSVLDSVAANCALSHLCVAPVSRLPSILLLGQGGVGKTAFARALAHALGLSLIEIALGGVTSGFVLAGLDVGYATGKPGRVFEALALGGYANPIIVLDELDKASTDSRYPVTPILYTLLERITASTFVDEAIPLPIDASHVQWVATANYEEAIEPALLSRFEVFAVPVPTAEQTIQIARYLYLDTIAAEPWGVHFPPVLDSAVLERFTELPPRETRKALIAAFGRAAIAGRRYLSPDDIRIRPRRRSPGFS
jgi:ATP-dependent Lon protease